MSNWNQNFTALIRASRPTLWGNWALNPLINPGTIGIIDSGTGNFMFYSDSIPNAVIKEANISQKWDVESSDVEEQQSNIELDGSATDPETQTKIKAGLQITWGFKNAGSLKSSFAQSKESTLQDFATLVKNQMEWLKAKATDLGMTDANGIAQGFCIVTDVIYAKSGINVGANSASSSFSIQGSINGTNELTGNSLSGKGSYVSTSETASMDKHTWPSSPNQLADDDVPIAFAVASFYENMLIPNWTHFLSNFVLFLDNSHNGTYVAFGTLTYDLNGEKITKTVSNVGISGGRTGSIGDIDPRAENLVFVITYGELVDHDTNKFTWESPRNQWLTGIRHIDLHGVWPGTPTAIDREA